MFLGIINNHLNIHRIKITKDKPTGAISGIQNPVDQQIVYQNKLPDTCQLSK